jgi:hypothetical protein
MSSSDLRETREIIAAANERVHRLERLMGQVARRFLWILRIFVGGAALGAAKLNDWKDLFHVF